MRRTLVVPDQFPTIQAAVEAAKPKDRILVKAGTYRESVEIHKPLSLASEGAVLEGSLDADAPVAVRGLRVVATGDVAVALHAPAALRGLAVEGGRVGILAEGGALAARDIYVKIRQGGRGLWLRSLKGAHLKGLEVSSLEGPGEAGLLAEDMGAITLSHSAFSAADRCIDLRLKALTAAENTARDCRVALTLKAKSAVLSRNVLEGTEAAAVLEALSLVLKGNQFRGKALVKAKALVSTDTIELPSR